MDLSFTRRVGRTFLVPAPHQRTIPRWGTLRVWVSAAGAGRLRGEVTGRGGPRVGRFTRQALGMGRRVLLRQHRTQPGTLDGYIGNITSPLRKTVGARIHRSDDLGRWQKYRACESGLAATTGIPEHGGHWPLGQSLPTTVRAKPELCCTP